MEQINAGVSCPSSNPTMKPSMNQFFAHLDGLGRNFRIHTNAMNSKPSTSAIVLLADIVWKDQGSEGTRIALNAAPRVQNILLALEHA